MIVRSSFSDWLIKSSFWLAPSVLRLGSISVAVNIQHNIFTLSLTRAKKSFPHPGPGFPEFELVLSFLEIILILVVLLLYTWCLLHWRCDRWRYNCRRNCCWHYCWRNRCRCCWRCYRRRGNIRRLLIPTKMLINVKNSIKMVFSRWDAVAELYRVDQ